MPRRGTPDPPKAPGETVTEPLKSIQTPSGPYGALGHWNPDPRYLFGSGAEVDSRQPQRKYDVRDPSVVSPHFSAIRPGGTGKSLNEPVIHDFTPTGKRAAAGHKFGGPLPR